jgi:hypothetical protein
MRFSMPHLPQEFDISDAWLKEAGFNGVWPATASFKSSPGAALIPLTEIEPVARFKTTPKDGGGFDRDRLVKILRRIISEAEIDPVFVMKLPYLDLSPSPYRYTVKDGYHRFYASIAGRFSELPAIIVNE